MLGVAVAGMLFLSPSQIAAKAGSSNSRSPIFQPCGNYATGRLLADKRSAMAAVSGMVIRARS